MRKGKTVSIVTLALGLVFGLAARPAVAATASLFDAKLFVQLDFADLTVENRAQRLADMRAAGADALQIAVCEFFSTGEARRAKLAKMADMIAYFEGAGYPVAIWTSSLGYGEPTNPDYLRRFPRRRRLKSLEGQEAVMCATDEAFAAALEENVRDFIRAGAKFILWDDDFVQSCRPGVSCVCDAHLALYGRRVGRPVTAEDVRRAFVGAPNAVRTAYLDMMGETLMALAGRLRRAADAVDPTVGMGVCASYTHYGLDGVDMERLARTFCGKGQARPFLRLSGAPYWASSHFKPEWRKLRGMDLGSVVEFVRSQTAHFRGVDIRLLDENDPYPRKSNLVLPGLCEVYDKTMIAEGRSVRNKYMLRYGKDRTDTAYLDAHLKNLALDQSLARVFRDTRPVGFRVYGGASALRSATFPEPFVGEHELKALASFPLAGVFLAQSGVPTQYERDDTPGAAFGPAVLAVPEAAYARGLLIDLSAARELTRRGVDVGLREGSDFWLHANATGGKFAVIGHDCLDLAYGDGVEGEGRRLGNLPLDEAWRFFTGTDLPARVDGNRGVYLLAKEDASGALRCLLYNVRNAPSGDVSVVIRGESSVTNLPAFGVAVESSRAVAARDWPFAILRSYGSYARNRTFTDRVFAAQERHPGLFGEIWFAGLGDPFVAPELAGRQAAEENLAARARCKALGIAFSYQEGVTLNHGPDGVRRAAFPDDAWAVDWKGCRQYGLFCANATAARDFSREKAKAILAALKPDSYWPDDDLRISKVANDKPAICYCTNCLALFGAKTGRAWTRESLLAALTGPNASAEVRKSWCAFNGESLGGFARVYREAVDAASPQTRLGIQAAFTVTELEGDGSRQVVKALSDGRHRVGIRPGYGYYTDQKPREMLDKMLHIAREASRSARLHETAQICYECENWPHVGAHKNPHGQMAECALALAMGCDSLAFYWGADQNGEDEACDNFWLDAVAAWRPFHLAVRDAFAETRLGGVSSFFGANRYAVNEWLRLSEDDLKRLAGNGLPVTVPESEPDAYLVTELTVRTLAEADLPKLFARPTLMEPSTLKALAKRFPTLTFPNRVRIEPLPAERAEATVARANGYEKFASGCLSDKLQAFVYPQGDDVRRFSEMTNDPKATGTCIIPTEFGGRVVLVQDANGKFPHFTWPGGRRHAILDALDAAVPGGLPVRLLTDGYAASVMVRKTVGGKTAGVFVLNFGMGETPPLELAIRRGAADGWRVVRPRQADEPAELVRTSTEETVVRVPPLPAFGVALIVPAK